MREPYSDGLRRILIFSAVLVASGIAVFAVIPQKGAAITPIVISDPLMWAVLVLGFALAELMVFHIELRRDAITLSLSEVPLAFALLYVAPWAVVAARLLGTILGKASTVRGAPHKFAFNMALVFFETAAVIALLRVMTGVEMWSASLGWIAFMVALAVPNIVSAGMVAVAISLFEGGNGLTHLKSLHLQLYYPVTASIAVLAVLPSVLDPALGWLPAVPIAATWILLRSHGNLTQRHRDLMPVSGFAETLNSSPHLEEVLAVAAEHARALLRADLAFLAVRRWDNTLAVHVAAVEGDGAPEDLLASCDWDRVIDAALPSIVLKGSVADLPVPLQVLRDHHAMIIPLRSRDNAHGLLVVVDRSGVGSRFVEADFARGEAIAHQLTAAISNGGLHQQISHQASHDRSTGLSNRHHFEEIVDSELRSGDRLALMVVQLGQVKDVQDTLGTVAADRLLSSVADRVISVIGEAPIARIESNLLAIALPGLNRDEAASVRTELQGVTREPFELDGLHLVMSPTFGTALAPVHGSSATDLIRRAVVAVEAARADHRPHRMYSTDIDHHSEEQLELLADLRKALECGAVDVHFQPQLNIATGNIDSAEALIRWTHPERGLIPPDEFIPAVEQSTLIGEVTDYVLGKVLSAIESLDAEHPGFSIALNVSAADLLDDQLPNRVANALAASSVEPAQVVLEITETSLIRDGVTTRATLDRLQRLGVKTSVDDFGTGYASLVYLRELATHEVKLDKRFVNGVLFDDDDAHIVKAMIDLAHDLGLRVVAEGVENDQMLHWLRSAGCDVAQGFGISRPLGLEQFQRWLEKHRHSETPALAL